jgi:hypothetical protein
MKQEARVLPYFLLNAPDTILARSPLSGRSSLRDREFSPGASSARDSYHINER